MDQEFQILRGPFCSVILNMKFRMFLMAVMSGSCVLVLMIVAESYRLLTATPPLPMMTHEELLRHEKHLLLRKQLEKTDFEHPILLWWHKNLPMSNGLKVCEKAKCYFTADRSLQAHPMTLGIFFYGTSFDPTDLPLPRRGADWALVHEESPKNNALFSHEEVLRLFNHTSTFRRYSDLPLTLQYLESINDLTDLTFTVPVDIKNKMISDGMAPVVYVQSSCDTPTDRDLYVQELMKHIRVDSYGGCLNNKALPAGLKDISKMHDKEFLHILGKYKFVLAFENAQCEDYVTEKLWRALKVGSIPVYFGAPNVDDFLPNPRSAVFVSDFESPKELAEYLTYLDNDDREYKEYLQHKYNLKYPVANEILIEELQDRRWGVSKEAQIKRGTFVDRFECLVCQRIAENFKFSRVGFKALPYSAHLNHYGCPEPSPMLEDRKDSWWTEHWSKAKFEAQVLGQYMEEGKNFTADQFYADVLSLVREENEALSQS